MLGAKLALVTGAGQGIGRAIALEMAAQGAAGVAVADRDANTVAESAKLIRGMGVEAIGICSDLRERDQVAAMVETAVTSFGGLDVLVNNAGVIETSLTTECAVDELPESVWDTVYEVNLKAVWLATKFAAPHLRRSTRGPNIVNAASVSGLTGFARAPAYCSTKGAVIQLTRATAVDLAPDVRCNCFCPGVIETPMARAFIERADDPVGQAKAMVATQLVQRLGRAEEVAKLVCYLASDDAGFITGAALPVDGGALAWHGVRA